MRVEMMKIIKIFLVLLVLFISFSAVSAKGNFTSLQDEIDSSTSSIDINQNYVYDNKTDYGLDSGILINKCDFTINGHGYTIDGSNQARIFDIIGSNITISNLIFINGNIDEDLGGALHASGSVILNNVTFKNNYAKDGGAISVSGQCIINNAIFTNNTADIDGGAIFAWNNLIINKATLTDNTASDSGGAIYAIGQTTINSALFSNNQADFGGAINTWANTIINSTTLTNNQAEYGGAIYVAGKTTINNVTFTSNTATENGGAISARDGTEINDAIFTNNKAIANGGAIFTNGNSNQISCIFENNSANNGGAIYFNNGISNCIINNTFNKNNAKRAGGAIYVREFARNNTITSEFNNNIANKASGGGIFFYKTAENNTIESIFKNNKAAYGAGMFFYSESNGNTIKGDFINNIALSCGGGMFFYNKSNYNKFYGNFINNGARGAIDVDNGNGGAITFNDTSKNSIFNCIFINNTARLLGGALNYRKTPYNITFNCDFINNRAESGGGINFVDNSYNITFNCNFIGNHATYGGGIAISTERNNNLSSNTPANAINIKDSLKNSIFNCNFTDNIARYGGAISLDASGSVTNCNFINNSAEVGGAIYANKTLTLSNITFIDNYAKTEGGAVGFYGNSTLNCDNSHFIDNYAEAGSSIFVKKGVLNLYNSDITSKAFNKYSQIAALVNSTIYIENSTFANITSAYSPALYARTSKTSIINSKFINLKGNITSGAIGIRLGGVVYIKNCEFINTTSSKNAGAVYADIAGEGEGGNMTMLDCVFKDTYSDFGGAFLQLGGDLLLNNTKFINSHATYNGGSVYLSFVNGMINNCTFDSNDVDAIKGYPTYGGALFLDMGTYNINDSKFFNNNASAGSAIYAYDSSYNIKNSKFENNTNPIYTVFDKKSNIDKSNIFINDNNISTNNTFYATIISGEGMQLTLLNNTINVTTLPSKFDLRDWGWVSSVKDQGWMGSCWTFGITGTLESALLKNAGITTDFSENNMQNTMIKYSIYGTTEAAEGGFNTLGVGYLLSWLGAFTQDADEYDEMGKISPVITTAQDIHVQDVAFTPNNEVPNGTQLKLAILNYGSIDIGYYGQSKYDEVSIYYNPETYAQYVNVPTQSNHEVSVVGWDDNFPKEKFLTTPPGDGAWIVKNSWGTNWGDNGYLYVSYYDLSFLKYMEGSLPSYATSIIFENTIPYNKNYQYDMTWNGAFIKTNGTAGYMNVYEALDNDAIAAVGTYFNQSGVNYTVEIYVNDVLKLTQTGVSPYAGYHTIKLNEYIPIKKGDIFKAKMASNAIPGVSTDLMRIHYTENMSFMALDGKTWQDGYDNNAIACLKVYTVALPIYTEDLVKIYKNDSRFEANIGVANETVTFEINGRNYTRVSDENGSVSIAINLNPGNYTVKTTFNDTTVENTITVLPTLIADDLVKYYRNASQFDIALVTGEGKPAVGKNITMNINGVFYNRITNENGTARLNINLPPGEYILTAIDPLTGLQMSYTITVLSVLNATDLEKKYKDGSTFNATVLDGQGNPLAGAAVTFNVNGIFYKKYTDPNGIAKLNINLPSGEYIITSEYDGLKVANTITIKD